MAIIGFYYFCAARIDLRPLYPWTVISRYFVLVVAIVLVVAKFAEPPLLIFGVIDFLGATWTLIALRRAPAMARA
jgi:hypothetical protein